jgi:lipopolysaccharide export LptBFGC system permease protein LptF
MPYCPDCGVEIGNAPTCPLCGTRNPRADIPAEPSRPEADASSPNSGFFGDVEGAETLTTHDKRKIAWEVLSVAFSIAVVSLSLINFLVEGRLSWSLFPVSAFIFIWIFATALLVMDGKSPLRYILTALDPPAFLLALGLFTGDISWAWKLAVPIAVFSELVAAGVSLQIKNAKRKGLNILAYLLVGIAINCLGIETYVDLFCSGKIHLTWSVITAIALIPIAGFLLYLHYRVAKSTNLHRLFKL